jgi:subtilisin family serine protease
MKSEAGITFLTVLLIPPLLVAALAAQSPIAPSVAEWLETARPDEKAAVWVFFTDKGMRTRAELERDLLAAADSRTPESLHRRLTARGAQPFDERDLPLTRRYVEAVGDLGVEFRAFSKWLNAVSVTAMPAQVEALARLGFVQSMRRVSGRKGGPEPLVTFEAGEVLLPGDYGESYIQLQQIQVPSLHDEGYVGTGIKVAVFDTGFWLDHETFVDLNVVAEWDFINDDSITANEPGDLEVQHNHGTMCLSIIGGHAAGTLIGPAYGADYILAKTEDMSQEDPVEEDWWIEAAEWADSLGAMVISSSLCYNDWYTYEDMDGNTAPITIAADLAVENGIAVLNAAGNSGSSSWKYILAPADGHNVISVGSVDSTGDRSYWSSQGPTYDGRIKPTVMAMGEDVFIADPAGGDTGAYRRGSGTSFATPLAAGAVALMLEKNPLWGPSDVTDAIMNTSTKASNPDTLYGYGILRAHAASEYPQAGVASAGRSGTVLMVYPNPATSQLLIRHPRGAGYARVFDVAGRLVGEIKLSPDGITRTDLGEVVGRIRGGAARGVYFIESGSAGTAKVLLLK